MHEIFEKIGRARGFIVKGGEVDYKRTAKILLDEFRGEKLGRITLEMPEDIKDMSAAKKQKEEEQKETRKPERKGRHPKYGEGEIISEDEMMIELEFPGYGKKQFLKAFGEVEVLKGL